jgi:glucose/mannose-6-phosphate isomerase
MLDVPPVPAAAEVLVAGMGGSAMAGDVAALVAADAGMGVTVHRGYGLPAWAVHRRPLVLAVSYSGNTEETLSVVDAAADAGLDLAVVCAGGELGRRAVDSGWPVLTVPIGLQPRAAVAYQAGAVARLLQSAGIVPDQVPGLEEAAGILDRLFAGGDGAAVTLGRDLAHALQGRITVVYGGTGLGALAAMRWKTQVNENAKMPAFWNEVPELNHNELEGWGTLADLTRRTVGIVMLRDPSEHPRVQRRMDLTAETISDRVPIVGTVEAQGAGALARFFSLAAVGDVASLEMARLAGVDPTPVALLERFKRRLREG